VVNTDQRRCDLCPVKEVTAENYFAGANTRRLSEKPRESAQAILAWHAPKKALQLSG